MGEGKRRKILLIGPLPKAPLTGGIAIGLEMLLNSSLGRKYEFILLNRSERRIAGSSVICTVRRQLIMIGSLIKCLVFGGGELVHVKTSSYRNFVTNCVYLGISRCLFKKTILQIHGGEFDRWYKSSSKVGRWLIRAGLRVPAKIFVLSLYWKEFVGKMVGFERIFVVPNGVKAAAFERKGDGGCDFGGGGNSLRVMFLGAPSEEDNRRKGLDDVLKAMLIVAAKEKNVVFVFAGFDKGSGSYREVERVCHVNGLAGRVQIMGVISGVRKTDVLAGSDIFLLPSYGENMPNTVLEAMAAGLPVIATNVGAIPELIEEGVGGFLVEPGDWKGISERVIQLVECSDLRSWMGENMSLFKLIHPPLFQVNSPTFGGR